MRLAVISPNRVEPCTRRIAKAACLVKWTGVQVDVLEPQWGPVELSGPFELILSAAGVLDRVWRDGGFYDGIVLAGFGEPGLEAVREVSATPAVDITVAATALAVTLGRRYLVVTSTNAAVGAVNDRLRVLRLNQPCAGVVSAGMTVSELASDPTAATNAIAVATEHNTDSADVIVLGCGGMAGLAPAVASRVDRPVVDPVIAGVNMIQQELASTIRSQQLPRRPAIEGWPLVNKKGDL